MRVCREDFAGNLDLAYADAKNGYRIKWRGE
jgi:hypothetical protein